MVMTTIGHRDDWHDDGEVMLMMMMMMIMMSD